MHWSRSSGTARRARSWVLRVWTGLLLIWMWSFQCVSKTVYQSCNLLVSPQQLSSLTTPSGKWTSFCTTDWAKLSICPQSPKCEEMTPRFKDLEHGLKTPTYSVYTFHGFCLFCWSILMTCNFLLIWVSRVFHKSLGLHENTLNSSVTRSFLSTYFKHRI